MKLKTGDRFKRYLDKFRKVLKPEQSLLKKETLGDILVDEVSKSVKARLDQIIPLVAEGGSVKISCNSGSFWEQPRKQLILFTLIEFDENVIWKSETDRHEIH